jgi:hypothetical protein
MTVMRQDIFCFHVLFIMQRESDILQAIYTLVVQACLFGTGRLCFVLA